MRGEESRRGREWKSGRVRGGEWERRRVRGEESRRGREWKNGRVRGGEWERRRVGEEESGRGEESGRKKEKVKGEKGGKEGETRIA